MKSIGAIISWFRDKNMWFIFAFIGAFITGIGQVLVKRGQVKLTPLLDNFIAMIIVNLILVPFLWIWGVDINVGIDIILYALIAATMYAIFYYIISVGDISLMISLINAFPVVTIFLAISFLHEWPNLYQWIGIILVVFGTILISREKEEKKIVKNRKRWMLWGLFGAFTIGTAEFVTKLATNKVDGFTFTFFVYIMYIPILIIFMVYDKAGRKLHLLKSRASLIYTVIGIFFIELGLIAIALAYQYGLASLVSPIVASHLLITAILAVIFLKEKLLNIQKLGIVFTLIGLIIIGMMT